MQFQPKTEKQLVEERLMPAGVYPFEVLTSDAKFSKSGNEMIELSLRLFMKDGTQRSLKDFIMEKMAFKLFHFCAYTGLAQKYEAGTLTAEDCVGCSGFAKIIIQSDKLGQYPDRNSVADYVRSLDGGMKSGAAISTPSKPQPTDAKLSNTTEDIDEDVPF